MAELWAATEQGGFMISGLRGMGGVGKTALALKLAAQLVERYSDAQLFVEMRGSWPSALNPAEAMAHVIRIWLSGRGW